MAPFFFLPLNHFLALVIVLPTNYEKEKNCQLRSFKRTRIALAGRSCALSRAFFFSIIATSQFFVQVWFFFSFLRAYLYLPHFSFSFLFPFITFAGLRKYRISVYIIIAVVILNSVLVTIPRVNTLTHTST